jgi:hypothetical protein
MSVFSKTRIALITMSEGIASVVGKLFADLPMDGSADPTVTRALNTATRINSAGNIETVVANKGRISYRLGTNKCPNLLVERSRVNLCLQSENQAAVSWSKNFLTISANVATAPDGTLTADLGYPANNGVIRGSEQAITVVAATIYTNSIFIKPNNWTWVYVGSPDGSTGAWFNLVTGTIGTIQSGVTARIESHPNGWFRIIVTKASVGTTGYNWFRVTDADNTLNATVNGTNGVYVWGAQTELGVIATSYIPTTTVAITRNADVITKTGISAILSGTQGLAGDCYLQAASLADSVIRTIAEVAVDANNFARISRLNNTIVGRVTVGGVEQAAITYTIPVPLRDKRCKVYLDFQLNNVNLYVNGLLVGTDTLADALTGLAGTYTGQSIGSANFWDGLIKSNVQMASLDATERDKWFQYASYSEMASELIYTTN